MKKPNENPKAELLPPDPERLAVAKDLKAPTIETVTHTGPCGDENPCGGGFGSRD